MKLSEILKFEAVRGDLKSTDKKGVLEELSDLISKIHPSLSSSEIMNVLLEREKLGSTGVGNGVAIPHGKIPGLTQIVSVFGRSQKGIDFDAHDQKPAQLFFVLLAPENSIGTHLQTLARLSRLLKSEATRQLLIDTPSDQLYSVLLTEDEKI